MRRLRYSLAGRASGALAALVAAFALSSCVNSLDEKIQSEIAAETGTALSSLVIESTGNGTNYHELALAPSFSSDGSTYVASMGNSTNCRVTVVPFQEGATATVSFYGGAPLKMVSGTAVSPPSSSYVPSGAGSIKIAVTSANGSESRTYTIAAWGGFLAGPTPELRSHAGATDSFGDCVAVSDDGASVVVGAAYQLTGGSLSADNPGKAYVFTRSGGSWSQAASALVASDSGNGDVFGQSACFSRDGSTLVIGGRALSSSTGAVYVFGNTSGIWGPSSTKLSSGVSGDFFGSSIATSSDGKIIAVGAYCSTEGSNSYQGAVYVFRWNGSSWDAGTKLVMPAGDAKANAWFGKSVALSGDGSTLAVGCPGQSSLAACQSVYIFRYTSGWDAGTKTVPSGIDTGGIFGGQVAPSSDGTVLVATDTCDSLGNKFPDSGGGAAFVANWNGSAFMWGPAIRPADTSNYLYFGYCLGLSDDGNTLALSAPDTCYANGRVYTFRKSGTAWIESARHYAPDFQNNSFFGRSLGLAGDGSTVAVGWPDGNAAYIF